MKVTVKEAEEKKGFPKVMISHHTGTVVFMIERNVGILLNDESSEVKKGELFKKWSMSEFKDFNGTVTLQND